LPESLLAKSAICKHPHGCLENGVRKAAKTFFYSFGVVFIIKLLSLAAKPAKILKAL
jgi:hypothetical protein